MKLILKARQGLVAKKISVNRGGKTYQQTVWVRAGKKEQKTIEQASAVSKEMREGKKKKTKFRVLTDKEKKQMMKDSLTMTSEEWNKKHKIGDYPQVKEAAEKKRVELLGGEKKLKEVASNPAFSGATTIENDKFVLVTNDDMVMNAEIEVYNKKKGTHEVIMPDEAIRKYAGGKNNKEFRSFIKTHYGI